MCSGLAAPKACSRGARRQEKGIEGGGERSHRSLSPSANRPAQLAGPTHPPQTRRPHPHCPPARRDVPRAVAAPSPAVSVSKSTAVDSVTTWVLRLSRDGHIGSSPAGLCGGAGWVADFVIRKRQSMSRAGTILVTRCGRAAQCRSRTLILLQLVSSAGAAVDSDRDTPPVREDDLDFGGTAELRHGPGPGPPHPKPPPPPPPPPVACAPGAFNVTDGVVQRPAACPTRATSTRLCENACCGDKSCNVWQWKGPHTVGPGGGCWMGNCNSDVVEPVSLAGRHARRPKSSATTTKAHSTATTRATAATGIRPHVVGLRRLDLGSD